MKHMRHIAKVVDDWTRVEAEFSGEYAHQITNAIKKCSSDDDLKNIIISSLIDRYMFFYVNSNRPHKITRLMLELLDSKNFLFESPSPRNNLLEQSIEHLYKGSGLLPTLWKVQQIWEDESARELIEYLYEQFENFEPNDDHISWLNKYKNYYINQGKPWEESDSYDD
ncbi:replication initiation factor domain-containing protein [Terribacillus sp. DMT04]|uniref:replication initiation factor domain-containing protein n=1 Tax=Terribacillus sp. DMT04 TaxID=2850441 RepID=UPI001C2C913D|nr:replication initiation factor domain-containing protein [Terribacillus sp. DMT04]QXE01913.1 replication initiation factor domain-containing protein [Terribacillus sp. DMT04]